MREFTDPSLAADQFVADLSALEDPTTQRQRILRKEYSRALRERTPRFVIEMGLALLETHGKRWHACELVSAHPGALQELDIPTLERFGAGINSWDSVDIFARTLSGPAWLNGVISDEAVHRWARSDNLWWRRAALVSTVALNIKTDGGTGDSDRTLAVCDTLLDDREDMVVKAMSWALRALSVPRPTAVSDYVNTHKGRLAARVKREVGNKLRTGLKNPERKRK